MLPLPLLLLAASASLSSAATLPPQPAPPPPTPARNLNADPPQPQSTACGDIVNNSTLNGYNWFLASDAIDCLTSVPFDASVATRFLRYYNQTLQFQSTSAYLRDPPLGYQQPAVDIIGGLQQMQDKINAGFYRNQYAFEADLQALSQATHDAHTTLYVGASNQFTFAAPFSLVSVSLDGKQTPGIYIYDDLLPCVNVSSCNATAVGAVNGVPIVEYLTDFAAHQSFGLLEPNADWNRLMVSPAQQIIGSANAFSGGATFYPGDNLTIEYVNGESVEFFWLALYNSPGYTGPLETGGDFYNFFVLGNIPASYNDTQAEYDYNLTVSAGSGVSFNDSCTSPLTSWNCVSSAYPANPISFQQYLGVDSSGFITGYFLSDISTAVVSIPSFDEYGDGIGTFSQAIIDFIGNASQLNASKIIIDLQQNNGGQESLAFEVFARFFPGVHPFAGSRMRSHYLANVLGTEMTSYFQNLTTDSDDYDDFVAEEWVVTDRINAVTGQNFTSWPAFFGPAGYFNGDAYSQTEQYNLSSEVFDNDALNVDYPACYYNDTCSSPALWSGGDIVLLTDGLCDSSCALFLEMMTQTVGARTVAVGGRPEAGPMQAASGSRGASAYSSDLLDADFYTAAGINSTDNGTVTQVYNADTGMQIFYAGFNLRDQIRPNATVPNQFLYLPAECRIYWSFANWYNESRLWHDTYNAIFGDTSICVPGSLNATAPVVSNTSTSSLRKRESSDNAHLTVAEYVEQGISVVPAFTGNRGFGIPDFSLQAPQPLTFCDDGLNTPGSDAKCSGGEICRPIQFPCTAGASCGGRGSTCNGGSNVERSICVPSCRHVSGQGGQCNGYESCRPDSLSSGSKAFSVAGLPADSKSNARYSIASGHCLPTYTGNGQYLCSALGSNSFLQNIVQRGS